MNDDEEFIDLDSFDDDFDNDFDDDFNDFEELDDFEEEFDEEPAEGEDHYIFPPGEDYDELDS